MLYGISVPPRIEAVAEYDRFIVLTPSNPPNQRLAEALCVTVRALQVEPPVQLPVVGAWHGTFSFVASVEQ
jgi:hypothetical protein